MGSSFSNIPKGEQSAAEAGPDAQNFTPLPMATVEGAWPAFRARNDYGGALIFSVAPKDAAVLLPGFLYTERFEPNKIGHIDFLEVLHVLKRKQHTP